jgi:hypothetical protein
MVRKKQFIPLWLLPMGQLGMNIGETFRQKYNWTICTNYKHYYNSDQAI